MSQESNRNAVPLNMLLELAREDNPRLYDDLIRFNKGPKRINRLRFLANEGLLLQNGLLAVQPPASDERNSGRHVALTRLGDPAVSNALFGTPLPE